MGLVGANGAGKTTFYPFSSGELQEDEGMVEWERGTRIGYLPQESAPTGDETVLELATAISDELKHSLEVLRENQDPESQERLEKLRKNLPKMKDLISRPKQRKYWQALPFSRKISKNLPKP